MGLFDHFPYTNFHELNLAWILEALKEIQTTTEQFVAINSLKYADPIQWNITSQYEKNTIVIDPQSGTAYISVQAVPSGVALTNTDYWAVVFDLEQFVTKANNNFTSRVEEATTTTATFATPLGSLVIWGGELYVANTNIIAGDQYVVGSNITRVHVEDITGRLIDLATTDKSNLVASINELVTNLTNEITARENADTNLDTTLTAAITDEATARENADTNLDTTLTAAITNEATARENADTDLQNNIEDVISTIDSLEFNNNVLQASNVEEQRIYVAGTSGNDNNDGKTTSTPFKTIDKAFKAIEEYGYTAIRIRILESGTYITQAVNICNISLHLQTMVPNVIISFENSLMSPSFYNSYLHFETLYDTENKTEFLTIKTLASLPMYCDHCGMAITKVVFDGDLRSNFGNVWATKTFAHYYQFRCAQVFLDACGCDKTDATQPSLYLTNGFLRITGDFVTDTTVSGTPSTYCFRCIAAVIDIRGILTNVIATYTTPFSPEACLITGTIARLTGLMDSESRSPVAITVGTKPTYTINLEGLTIGYLYFTRLLDGNAKIRFRIDLPAITNETYSLIPLFTLNNVLVKLTANGLAYKYDTTNGDPEPRWIQISSSNNGVVSMLLSSAESGNRYYGELMFNELTPTRIREQELTS